MAELASDEERPWTELRRGRKLTTRWLAQQLRRYKIQPKTIRIGEALGKGYLREDFMEVLRRYIPRSEKEAFRGELKVMRAQAAERERKAAETAGARTTGQ